MYTNKTTRLKSCASESRVNWETAPELEKLTSPRFAPVWVAAFDTFCIAPAEWLHSNVEVKVTDKERNHIRTAAPSTEKWTLWSRSQLLCWRWEGWGWRTGHVLVGRVIVPQGLSAANEWPLRTPAPRFFLALCLIQVLLHFLMSRWCVDTLINKVRTILPVPAAAVGLWRHPPPCSAVPFFLLKVLIISSAFLLLCQWNATFLSPNKCCLTPIEQSKCES